MEKEVKLFDKRFVHFMWDDELKGKRGFLSSDIASLIKMVNEDSDRTEIQKGCERDLPFCKHITEECKFAYYDPNYSVKWAYYKEGKKVQVGDYIGIWADCHGEPHWSDNCKYRIKPECPCEEKAFRPFKDCDELVEFWSKNYQTGFRPAYTKPLIWVFNTQMKSQELIEAFVGDGVMIVNGKVDFCRRFSYAGKVIQTSMEREKWALGCGRGTIQSVADCGQMASGWIGVK